jgi:hypothetical protein
MSGYTPITATVLCRSCDAQISVLAEICPSCGVRQYDAQAVARVDESDKRIVPAAILSLLFGFVGAHRFYVGRPKTAIVQLLTLGGLGIWALIDFVLIVCGEFRDGEGRKLKS